MFKFKIFNDVQFRVLFNYRAMKAAAAASSTTSSTLQAQPQRQILGLKTNRMNKYDQNHSCNQLGSIGSAGSLRSVSSGNQINQNSADNNSINGNVMGNLSNSTGDGRQILSLRSIRSSFNTAILYHCLSKYFSKF